MADKTTDTAPSPTWWVWPVAAAIGALLVNAIPHGVMGVTGQSFPTPFSGGPPNLSPAWVNTAWSLFNLAAAYALLRVIARWRDLPAVRWTAAGTSAIFGIVLALVFADVV